MIDLVRRDALGFARVVHVVHDHRTDDAGGRPGGEQPAVNGPYKLGAEDVGEIGGDSGKAAAIHRGDETEGCSEQSQHAERGERRGRRVADEAQGEE
jgi:hypothetical protein